LTDVKASVIPAGCVTLTASGTPGSEGLSLEARTTGLVSGHLEEWNDYPAYDYTDLIGGSATEVINIW